MIGEAETSDAISAPTVAALHDLLDAAGAAPGRGDALPPLWHWLAFRPVVPQRELGRDGHPRLGLLDPSGAPLRRMWASGAIALSGNLPVAAVLRRTSRVASAERKSGRSGEITFVQVVHHIEAGSAGTLDEQQLLAYRAPAAPTGAPARPVGPPAREAGEWAWQREVPIEPTLLFRFSALTYNAHRIHYDRPYATGVEGYPGLVVHGPLQAALLAELCRQHAPERTLVSFDFRALAPAFDDGPLTVRARQGSADTWELQVLAHRGYITMTATAGFASVTGG